MCVGISLLVMVMEGVVQVCVKAGSCPQKLGPRMQGFLRLSGDMGLASHQQTYPQSRELNSSACLLQRVCFGLAS